MEGSIGDLTKQEQFERYSYLKEKIGSYNDKNFGYTAIACAAGTTVLYSLHWAAGVLGTLGTGYMLLTHIRKKKKIDSEISTLEKSLKEDLKKS